ncbi:MAG: nuclear transport factor 2 family protein [Thermoanaerobaculia bacterium]
MRRVSILAAIAGAAVWSLAALAQTASKPAPSAKQAADEVIALTKTIWAADMQKNVAGQVKYLADDYTEFTDDYPTRLDGKAINTRLAEGSAQASGSLVVAEMANEKVQVYGDVAILTYNFIGITKDKDGKTEPTRAKSTRVYVKQGGQWMLVHANFAPAK